ncbi:hypothetical protein JCM30471_11190 [Desulfuromonas carbonis]|nr:hypothetical protein DBW_2260 [Desulfuromonas sp. DDH964]
MRTDRLQRECGVELRWSVFPLHPETPPEGTELADLFGRSAAEIRALQERLQGLARDEGLSIVPRSRTVNSRRAQELGKWAEGKGLGEGYRMATFAAYFSAGRDISQEEELLTIIANLGLDPVEAKAVLAGGLFAAAVDTDWERARTLGVRAVPTHLCQERRLVGFSQYEDFLALVGQS